jgi:DNA-binding Xre family transcriptional regulator
VAARVPARLDYEWRLRQLLAERGIYSSAELTPLLAERGVRLSESQVWRLVTGKPERLNLHTLVVLCDILDCSPNDLIERVELGGKARLPKRRAAAGDAAIGDLRPKRARIRPPRGGQGRG